MIYEGGLQSTTGWIDGLSRQTQMFAFIPFFSTPFRFSIRFQSAGVNGPPLIR